MAPRRGAAAAPSLLSVPDSWLDAAPLAELKRAALRAEAVGYRRVPRRERASNAEGGVRLVLRELTGHETGDGEISLWTAKFFVKDFASRYNT